MNRWILRAGAVGGALCALLAAGLFLLGLPLVGISRPHYAVFATATLLVFTVVCFLVAAAVAARSRDPMAIYAAVMVAVIGGSGAPYTDALAARPALFVPARIGTFLLPALVVGFLLIFPTGRPAPRWAAIPFAIWAGALLVEMLSTPPYPPGNPPDFWGLLMFAGFLGGLICAGWRWLKVSDRTARAQTQWVLLGVGVAIVALGASAFVPALAPTGSGAPLGFALATLGSLAIPLSIAAAVTRYRLWDVDLVVNRAAVYAAVVVILTAAYLGIVLGTSALLTGRGLTIPSLVGAAFVAVAFQPLRQLLQRTVNRLMYGDRDDPQALLRQLGAALDESLAGSTVLPRIAGTVATALRLPYAAVVLRDGAVFSTAEGDPRQTLDMVDIPLVHQGEQVGALCVAQRSRRDAFTPKDLALIRELAVHIAAAVHAVLLAIALQESRESLVNARAEERRRLRRDLHDGMGPQLVSLALKLEAARNRAEVQTSLRQLLADLAGQTREVIADVRRLVYALRPPALDELGLIAALAQIGEAPGQNLVFEFDRPDHLPPLPAAVEVAAYRIAQEALTNVVRHADAKWCRLRLGLSSDGMLLEVTDDGAGLDDTRRPGIGLRSMRERAEELGGTFELGSPAGGGCRVMAFLPCRSDG